MAKAYKVAVIGGDGTGPEVVREGLKVLRAVELTRNWIAQLGDQK